MPPSNKGTCFADKAMFTIAQFGAADANPSLCPLDGGHIALLGKTDVRSRFREELILEFAAEQTVH